MTFQKMMDAQGRTILEALPDGRQTFYAWQDGYDENVAGGYLRMRAGRSYTLYPLMNNPQPAEMQAEVRDIKTKKLLGYALLIESTAGGSNFFETPTAFVDTNKDELVSRAELDAALGNLEEQAASTAALSPAAAKQASSDVATARARAKKGFIALAYEQINKTKTDLDKATAAAEREQAAKSRTIALGLAATAVVGLLGVVLAVLMRRRGRQGAP